MSDQQLLSAKSRKIELLNTDDTQFKITTDKDLEGFVQAEKGPGGPNQLPLFCMAVAAAAAGKQVTFKYKELKQVDGSPRFIDVRSMSLAQ
jgi:hypothetical protein